MLVFQEASFPDSEVAADADSATITGRGSSANVTIDLTLVPHADVTLKDLAASDCMKGTLTATITTVSDYYDKKWTACRRTDTPIAFGFDTFQLAHYVEGAEFPLPHGTPEHIDNACCRAGGLGGG